MKLLIRNYNNNSSFGLILNWDFHEKKKWVSAYTAYLVNAIIDEFNPIIIDSQLSYFINKNKLHYILSFEPGIASPKIKYDRNIDCKKGIIYSDPHYKPLERLDYFRFNAFDTVFSLYKTPFFKHFTGFREDQFIHWPWAVPDQFINSMPLHSRSNEVAIFGGNNSDAYDVRNWCRHQSCVTNFNFSGVENKEFSDEEFYRWLTGFDAIVAAGSSNVDYNLVTPKYFEIAAAGALLVGQYCDDLSILGFDDTNCVVFKKESFVDRVMTYRSNPEAFLELRDRGRKLIAERHSLSHRIGSLRDFFYGR